MTSATNPLLVHSELPAFSHLEPIHVEPAIDNILRAYRATIAQVTEPDEVTDFAHVMLPQETMEVALNNAFAPVGHLHSVANTPQLRQAYAAALEKITDFASDVGQNRDLYDKVTAVATQDAVTDVAQQAALTHALRDFKLAGVALDEPQRSRFREITQTLSKLTTEFSNAVMDATDAWHLHLADASRLQGVPPSDLQTLETYARDKGLDGYLITLHRPAVHAILTYADDRDLRQTVCHAYQTRASDQGPDAGKYDNSQRMEQIIALRHEAAQLLGFANAAEASLATKMAPDTDTVMAFLDDLITRARPVAQREMHELETFAQEQLGLESLAAWDIAYAAEHLRRERYALDEEQLKPYFAAPHVIDGLFALVGRLYGIHLKPRKDVDTWHPDVLYFDVFNHEQAHIAGLYMDLYARNGKRGGAWMDVCRQRFVTTTRRQLPIAFLTCNFAPPSADQPALIKHDDVVTLFHEFGHCLHHLLTEIDIPSVGGIDGVEWDAVELPSQFMENFCWDYSVLKTFARHHASGAVLPPELFERMQRARHFHAGMSLVRQLEFALFDFRLHRDYDPAFGARVQETLDAVRAKVAVINQPHWNRFAHAFSHIFAGGYAAGYYSYLWAEVLSADAFSLFQENGVVDAATGDKFRREVLARGATRPTLENFTAFRGRAPEIDALLASHGLTAA